MKERAAQNTIEITVRLQLFDKKALSTTSYFYLTSLLNNVKMPIFCVW